jgi:hypothetical protein
MELFIRYWSPGPGENPEKVQGRDSGLGENFHRVEGDRGDPGIRPHWLGRVSRSVEKSGISINGHIGPRGSPGPWRNRKKVKCCGRSPGVISLPRQGHSWSTARRPGATPGVSWGSLPEQTRRPPGATPGVTARVTGYRVPGTGRGLAKFRRLHRSSPPGRDLPRETPRVRADLYRPVQTCTDLCKVTVPPTEVTVFLAEPGGPAREPWSRSEYKKFIT